MSERLATALLLLLITPLGFATKWYQGPLAWWVNGHAGGLLYVTFWILLVVLINPRWSAWSIAVTVLVLTCLVEILQLWHPPVLELLRDTFWGRTLLGHSFSWWDFPYYFFGAALGYGLAVAVRINFGKDARQ